jgi:hypothetical protein
MGREASAFCDPSEHARTDLLVVVECDTKSGHEGQAFDASPTDV